MLAYEAGPGRQSELPCVANPIARCVVVPAQTTATSAWPARLEKVGMHATPS